MTDGQASVQSSADSPSGIGGWLILPIIGLVVTPLRGVAHLASYGEILQSMGRMTGGQASFIVIEVIGNAILLLVLPIALLVLLFRKSAAFPRWFVIWAAAGLVFMIADLVIAQVFFGDVLAAAGLSLIDADTLPELIRGLVLAVIWIPYMRLSRRVANTFVN